MLEMLYETDVHKWVLLSDPPFVQKSRIQVLKMVNWRTVERRGRRGGAPAPDLLARAFAITLTVC